MWVGWSAFVAQLVERSLGKTEVSGSIPDKGSRLGDSLEHKWLSVLLDQRQDTEVVKRGSL